MPPSADRPPHLAAGGQRAARRLAGRKVLVVGGGGSREGPAGNGHAISVLAAREGAAVAVADIDPRVAGGTAAAVIADVRRPDDCERLVAEAIAALGGLDGLVLNVGIGKGRGLAGTDSRTWDEVLAVNLRSHFLVARAALPAMSGGAVVFIGSLAGLQPGTFSPSYDASKAALIPLGRQGTAWEVGWAAVFLLSAEASYITAQVLVVDGGLGILPRRDDVSR